MWKGSTHPRCNEKELRKDDWAEPVTIDMKSTHHSLLTTLGSMIYFFSFIYTNECNLTRWRAWCTLQGVLNRFIVSARYPGIEDVYHTGAIALGLWWQLWKWLALRVFLSAFPNVCSSLIQCSILRANIWMKHKIVSSNTNTLIHFREVGSIETFTSVSLSSLEGTCGENKINGFNFVLANQIPIKLKEKFKSGQFEH